jgi:cold shock CspA family protein/ribosome-associated translation inhibitor RaiA
MERPLEITARNVVLPEEIESLVRRRAAALERFYPRLVGCSVVLEGPGEHHRKGGPYSVRLDLRLPDREPLLLTRQSEANLATAVGESFDAAVRRLEDEARKQRGSVKTHEPPALSPARVARLFPREGYGFLETPDGREIYFHRHSVVQDGYENLAAGDEVTFLEERGDRGPQASAVFAAG